MEAEHGPLRLQAARRRRRHAEAEIVAWHVKVGDTVKEDQQLVDVMTDKATVEMTSPVAGRIVALHGELGEKATVGAPLVELEVEGAGNAKRGRSPSILEPCPAAARKGASPTPISTLSSPARRAPHRDGIEEVKVIGLRRKIAEKMQEAKRRIPHYTYVEEIDMTELEALRAQMNAARRADQPKLNVLPFLILALVRVLPDFPQINALSTTKRA
jgi:2-oxoisovalerate dehydrogenase E2 component (dihydrolipoyl transacylase)